MDTTQQDDDRRSPSRPQGGDRKVPLGLVLMGTQAQSLLNQADVAVALRRHARGDWGEVSEDDRKENELSLEKGFRLLSVYHDRQATKFWIITEADRSTTTILLPEEY